MIRIRELIRESLVVLELDVATKEELFRKLSCVLSDCACITDGTHGELCGKLELREQLGSTGLGHGIAIPHAYYDGVTEPVVLFARTSKPIEFGAIDGQPVNKIFLMLGPQRDDTTHVMILARLSRLLRDEIFLKRLDTISTPGEFIEAVEEVENRHS